VSEALSGEALQHAKTRERQKVVRAVLQLALAAALFVIWVPLGASDALRDATGGDATLMARVIYVLAFMLIGSLIDFPLAVYFSYVSEKRFGLLKQSFAAWLLDYIKQGLVGTALIGTLLLALYAVFAAFPGTWFAWSLGVIAVFFAVMLLIQPALVRLQFKTEPIHDPELGQVIRDLFDRAGVPLAKVSQVKFSEKTRQANAALLPSRRGSDVILSDTLIASVGVRGTRVVLAHELGHRVHRDIPKLLLLAFAQFGVALVVANALFGSVGQQFGLRGAQDIATLPVFLLALTLVTTVWSVLTNAVMRRAEYAADRYALELTGDVEAFEHAMRALARDNLADPDPPRWVEVWLHNHPSIDKRIAAAHAWARAQSPGTSPHAA